MYGMLPPWVCIKKGRLPSSTPWKKGKKTKGPLLRYTLTCSSLAAAFYSDGFCRPRTALRASFAEGSGGYDGTGSHKTPLMNHGLRAHGHSLVLE